MEFDFQLPGLGRPESSRPKRVAEAIRNELTLLLRQKVRDPRLASAAITLVVMTPDLKLAKISFAISGEESPVTVKKGLERAKGFYRSELARTLNLRYTPQLVFYHDRQGEVVAQLDDIFADIDHERRNRKIDDDRT
jgi:ribosome-binding factor A